MARTKWEDSNINDGETSVNLSQANLMRTKPDTTVSLRGSKSPRVETKSLFSQASKSNSPKTHLARFLYSQIDLGSDDESSRGASPASHLSRRSRAGSQSKIEYGNIVT